MSSKEKDVKRVLQSIDRAVSILDFLSERPRGERLSTIARELGLNKSTAFTIISSLEELHLLSQDQESGKYSLGVKMMKYGLSYQRNLSLVTVAQPYLDALSDRFNETVHMAILAGKEAIYIAKAEGSSPVRITSMVGAGMPLHCCSLGKVLLANLSDEKLLPFLEKLDYEKYTENTISSPEELRREIVQVRRNGYAFDREERQNGLFCIAAPIRNDRNDCVAAISISLPVSSSERHGVDNLLDGLVNTAREISCKLGNEMS